MTSFLTRRHVLRGAGVALALPWLESLAPRPALGQAAPTRKPFVAMSFPLGASVFWKPPAPGAGDGWALSPVLQPLAPIKSHVNVLANVGNYGPFGGHIEPAHGNLTAALLTCTRATALNGIPSTATSADQVIAQAFGGQTKLDSLQVGLSTLDSFTDGLPDACSRSISWRSPADPTFKLVDPQAVFDKLVASGAATAPALAADPFGPARRAANKSVLDYVLDHAATVHGQLGRDDRARMDDFLTQVRALETRVAAGTASFSCTVGARPPQSYTVGNVPPDYDRGVHADVMIDLVVMALQCDVTRVVSFMLDDARSDFVYDFLKERVFTPTGSTEGTAPVNGGGLHGLAANADNNSGYATVNFWFVEKLARLCQTLASIPEGSGTLLDAATVWFGSEMHGPNDDGRDLPIITVGKGGGRLETNQYVDFATTPRQTERLANLYLTFLRGVFDLPITTFGGQTPPTNPGATPENAFGAGTELIPEILA